MCNINLIHENKKNDKMIYSLFPASLILKRKNYDFNEFLN